jgi:hypothetical protein
MTSAHFAQKAMTTEPEKKVRLPGMVWNVKPRRLIRRCLPGNPDKVDAN